MIESSSPATIGDPIFLCFIGETPILRSFNVKAQEADGANMYLPEPSGIKTKSFLKTLYTTPNNSWVKHLIKRCLYLPLLNMKIISNATNLSKKYPEDTLRQYLWQF